MMNNLLIATFIIFLCFSFSYAGDYEEGRKAYDDELYTEALNLYLKAANEGNAKAQFDLGYMYYAGKGVEKNFNEAKRWYQSAIKIFLKDAEDENMEAQYYLGIAYATEQGVKQDFNEAFKWFQLAASNGHAQAQSNIGSMYENGQGVEKDSDKAFMWTLKAAEKGNASAQASLAGMYLQGRGVDQNYEESFKWRLKAAEQGDTSSQVLLANMYHEGQGVEKNIEKAIYWSKKANKQREKREKPVQDEPIAEEVKQALDAYLAKDYEVAYKLSLKAAENGNTDAHQILVWMYQNGHGVEKDKIKARYWKNKSRQIKSTLLPIIKEKDAFNHHLELAEQENDVEAHYKVGVAFYDGYYLGDGKIEQDYEKAMRWFNKAALLGHMDAKIKLAGMFATGTGTEKNKQESFRWYMQAAEQGDSGAQSIVGGKYWFERNYEEAFKWNSKAAEQGNTNAQKLLGEMYLTGQGVKADPIKGISLLTKAGEKGSYVARDVLVHIYTNGKYGVKRDPEKAKHWKNYSEWSSPAK